MHTNKNPLQSVKNEDNTNIYILKLENNKYYVGKSNNLEIRAQAHINGTASLWTKKYKPISVETIIPNASSYDENKYTIEYMGKYGIDNVRGGIYVTEALDNTQRSEINKQIWGATDCCTQCGRKGHFVKNCKATKDVTGQDIIKTCQDIIKETFNCRYCDKEFETQKGAIFHENVHCKSVPKKKETFNCRNCNKEFETQKGAIFHENVHCKSVPKKNECYRCGRSGHYSNNCYAKSDIDGYQLDSENDSDNDSNYNSDNDSDNNSYNSD
jgi:hypothetical protein